MNFMMKFFFVIFLTILSIELSIEISLELNANRTKIKNSSYNQSCFNDDQCKETLICENFYCKCRDRVFVEIVLKDNCFKRIK